MAYVGDKAEGPQTTHQCNVGFYLSERSTTVTRELVVGHALIKDPRGLGYAIIRELLPKHRIKGWEEPYRETDVVRLGKLRLRITNVTTRGVGTSFETIYLDFGCRYFHLDLTKRVGPTSEPTSQPKEAR